MFKSLQEFYKWERATEDVIDVKKIYIDMADDLIAGVLLSQIVYWFLPDKNGKSRLRVFQENNYWLVKRRDDWWEECRIKPRQYDTAIKKLKEKNLLITKIFKFNGEPTTHIRINENLFLREISRLLDLSEDGFHTTDSVISNSPICENQKNQGLKGFKPEKKLGKYVNWKSQIGEFQLTEMLSPYTENTYREHNNESKSVSQSNSWGKLENINNNKNINDRLTEPFDEDFFEQIKYQGETEYLCTANKLLVEAALMHILTKGVKGLPPPIIKKYLKYLDPAIIKQAVKDFDQVENVTAPIPYMATCLFNAIFENVKKCEQEVRTAEEKKYNSYGEKIRDLSDLVE